MAKVDISNDAQLAHLINQINRTDPPLRGIFHGAMVLDDGFLVDMNRSRFEKVMAPKVAGALNLHTHTKDLPLDFFISFSSISSLIGNDGCLLLLWRLPIPRTLSGWRQKLKNISER